MGELASGRPLIEEALEVSREGNIKREIAWNLCSLAANLVNSGMIDLAEPLLLESIAVGRECGDATPIIISMRILGQLYTAKSEYESARVVLEEGSSLARSLDMWNQVLDIQLGDLAAAQEDWDRGRTTIDNHCELQASLQSPDLWRLHFANMPRYGRGAETFQPLREFSAPFIRHHYQPGTTFSTHP
jgi:hypothetical protein